MVNFEKWQGCGNDFVMVDCLKEELPGIFELAVKVCDRHYGIGADGLIVILPSDKADFRMRIINADGSEAEMCGNGIRCFARMIYDNKLTDKTTFTVETGAGILVPRLTVEDGAVTGICIDMGEPVFDPKLVPVNIEKDRVVAESVKIAGGEYKITCVSMGNPHCVVFFDNEDDMKIDELGHKFETDALFPKKTNTEFALVKDKKHIRMRVWERGAAVTLACGTGSCATLVAAVLNGLTERKAEIELDGGKLIVEWGEDNHVYMTGPAERVYEGIY